MGNLHAARLEAEVAPLPQLVVLAHERQHRAQHPRVADVRVGVRRDDDDGARGLDGHPQQVAAQQRVALPVRGAAASGGNGFTSAYEKSMY